MVDFTLLVVTNNRAATLRDTLDALARQKYRSSWEVLVVDNNSTDDTTEVVSQASCSYPVPLRYAFEPRPGKSLGDEYRNRGRQRQVDRLYGRRRVSRA